MEDPEIKEYVLEEHSVEGGKLIFKQRTKTFAPNPEDRFRIGVVGSTFEVICDLIVIDRPFDKRKITVTHTFKNGGIAAAFYALLLDKHSTHFEVPT